MWKMPLQHRTAQQMIKKFKLKVRTKKSKLRNVAEMDVRKRGPNSVQPVCKSAIAQSLVNARTGSDTGTCVSKCGVLSTLRRNHNQPRLRITQLFFIPRSIIEFHCGCKILEVIYIPFLLVIETLFFFEILILINARELF